MPEYVRVKDKSTGHHYSVIASAFDDSAMTKLKQDAVNTAGEPLPPEFHTPSGQSADPKKETTNG